MIKQDEVFKIGRFAKPHGIKGELALLTSSDVFDDVEEDLYVVCDIDGIFVPFYIEEYRYKGDAVILVKLEYVNNEESAREFTNRDVYFPLDAVEESDLVGDMTWDSFIGYKVIDKQNGELGSIVDVDESTINVLLKIAYKGEELLLPAVEELITDVDHTDKLMTVSVPEGLLDL